MKTYRKPNEHLFFPIGGHTNILHKQQKDIKQKEKPQKYRLGTISNTKLLAGLNRFFRCLTSPLASAVVHNIYLVVRSSW